MDIATLDYKTPKGFTKKTLTVESTPFVYIDNVKNWLKVSTSDDDEVIQLLIDAAIDWAQNYTGRTLRTTTYTYEWAKGAYHIDLPYPPIQSVDAVRTKIQGVETTLTTDEYYTTGQDDLTLHLANLPTGAIEADVTAGYGASNVPAEFKLAIRKFIITNYDIREDIIDGGGLIEAPNSAKQLLKPYLIYVL